jgi:L-ascorbate oxidase
MAGALIVRGRRTIQQKRAGRALVADIDTILRGRNGRPLQERVLVFQQITYGCFDPKNPDAPFSRRADGSWNCPKDFIGEVRDYAQIGGPGAWDASKRFTSINGEVLPRLGRDPATGVGEPVYAGDITRWRMVHGGIRDAVPMQIVKVDPAAALQVAQSLKSKPNIPANIRTFADRAAPAAARVPNIEALQQLIEATSQGARADTADPNEDIIKELCRSSTSVPQVELAADGLTRSSLVAKPYNIMQPGYRSDILVAFPEPGLYCVLGLSVPPAARPIVTPTGQPAAQKPQDILMTVRVDPGRNIPNRYAGKAEQYALDEILAADQTLPENRRLPADVATRLGRNDLSDYAFSVDFNVPAGPERHIGYHVRPGPSGPKFVWNASAATPQPSTEDFSYGDDKAPVFEPRLGTMETWNLAATSSHIHHIHVNPFQIVDIRENNGKSIFDPDGICAAPPDQTSVDADVRQYCDQKGVFRDTMFVRPGLRIAVRTRYERYIGAFVLHCHILDHEDQGMMADVRILAPGEASAPATPHVHR